MRRLIVDVSPLREHPPYRNLWLGQLLTQFGRQATTLALMFQVYAATNSALAIGGLALMTLVALVLFALPAGALADALDRRRLMLSAQVGQIVVSISFASLAWSGQSPLWLLYGLTFVSAVCTTIDRPARRVSVSRLVRPERLASAIVLDSAGTQLAMIVGPAIAGILIAWVGLPLVFALIAALFAIAFAAVWRLPALRPLEEKGGLTPGSLIEGLRFLRKSPVILGSFAIDLSAMVFGLPVALFPILARDAFGGGPEVLGLLVAAPAVGAVAGTLSSGWVSHVAHQGRGVIVAAVVWALAIIAFGLSLWSLPLSLVLLAVAGAADIVSTVFRGAILQLAAPDVLRGRIAGVQILIFQGGPRLGDIEATMVASVVGAPLSVLTGGILCLIGTAIAARRFPELAAFEAPVEGNVRSVKEAA
jgi:MFS family permease